MEKLLNLIFSSKLKNFNSEIEKFGFEIRSKYKIILKNIIFLDGEIS